VTFRLITADDVCAAMESAMTDHLPGLLSRSGFVLDEFTDWDQVPELDALSKAQLPAGAITSPGLAATPVDSTTRGITAVWQVVVGVFDRGRSHDETARKVREWAALVRAAALTSDCLDGFAERVTWVGEEYAQRPERTAARTIGGCAVTFHVEVRRVVDIGPADPTTGDLPIVRTTPTTVSVR